MSQFQSPQPHYQYTQPEAYQQQPSSSQTSPVSPEIKRASKDGWIVLLLLLIWPVGLYFMWRDASWTTTTKVFVTIGCFVYAYVWLMFIHL